jgi:hypothetical protein
MSAWNVRRQKRIAGSLISEFRKKPRRKLPARNCAGCSGKEQQQRKNVKYPPREIESDFYALRTCPS